METSVARVFFAARPDLSALDSLVNCQQDIKNHEPWQHRVRWIHPDNIHLTLRFLGDTPRSRIPEIIEFVNNKLKMLPLTFVICDTRVFPNARRPAVIAATIAKNRELSKLARRLNRLTEHFGYKPEERRFRPHITLGRCGKGFPRGVDVTGRLGNHVPSRLEHVILYESLTLPEGAQYKELARFDQSPAIGN